MSGVDPGSGNERTALAWQRTALSLIAGSLVLARLTFDRLGSMALVSVVVALPLSMWVFIESRHRYAHDVGIQVRSRSRGGRAPAALTIAASTVAFTELASLIRSP